MTDRDPWDDERPRTALDDLSDKLETQLDGIREQIEALPATLFSELTSGDPERAFLEYVHDELYGIGANTVTILSSLRSIDSRLMLTNVLLVAGVAAWLAFLWHRW